MTDDALKLARDALFRLAASYERIKPSGYPQSDAEKMAHGIIATLDAALAAQAEPVAHLVVIKTDAGPTKFFTAPSDPRGFPVYAASQPAVQAVGIPVERVVGRPVCWYCCNEIHPLDDMHHLWCHGGNP